MATFLIERLEHVRTLNCWPFYRLHGLAMDRQGRLYVLSEYNSVLMVFDDPRSSDVLDRVMPSGGFKSHLVAVSRDGSMAFSINLWSHTITYLQPHNPTAQPMPIYAGERPEGNCFGPEDRVLYPRFQTFKKIIGLGVTQLIQ